MQNLLVIKYFFIRFSAKYMPLFFVCVASVILCKAKITVSFWYHIYKK